MILAIYRDIDGKEKGGLYDTFTDYYRDTFSPECEELFIWDFKSHGKSYSDRKESVRDKAIEWSWGEMPGLYMGEIAYIESEFRRLGKQYGLLREFHENCIC